MPIVLFCKCGQRLRAADDMRGRRVFCPKCGQTPRVPVSDNAPLAETLMDQPAMSEPLLDALREVAGGVNCPACGTAGKPGAVACHQCGSSLETGMRVTDAEPAIRLHKRSQSWMPTWVLAMWSLIPRGLKVATPRGIPLTVSGTGALMLAVIGGSIGLLITSNTEAARTEYLRMSVVRQLETQLSGMATERLRSDLIRALRFHELESQPLLGPDHASRRFKGALALGAEEKPTVIAKIKGEFDPGTLFIGMPVFPGRTQVTFEVADDAVERLIDRRIEPPSRTRR